MLAYYETMDTEGGSGKTHWFLNWKDGEERRKERKRSAGIEVMYVGISAILRLQGISCTS